MAEGRGVRRTGVQMGVVVLIAAVVALLAPLTGPAHAGDDVCEPNDQFQQACYLGPESDALGFLSTPDDVDIYRIEALDFGARVRIELRDLPFEYRAYLADWKGDYLAESAGDAANQAIDQVLGPPGTYYILVDSRRRQATPDAPYRISTRLTYPEGPPNVLYSAEFRQPGDTDIFTGSNEFGSYRTEQGRYYITVRRNGTPSEPEAAWSWWAPIYTDFTFVADVRNEPYGAAGGYYFSFRRQDDDNLYMVLVNVLAKEVAVLRRVEGNQRIMVRWTPAPSINQDPGINRVIVRSVGADHHIMINGAEVAQFVDDLLPAGQIGLGGLSFGGPPVTIVYDNVIVTSPR